MKKIFSESCSIKIKIKGHSVLDAVAYDSLNPPFALLDTTETEASLNVHASAATAVPTASKAGSIERRRIVCGLARWYRVYKINVLVAVVDWTRHLAEAGG